MAADIHRTQQTRELRSSVQTILHKPSLRATSHSDPETTPEIGWSRLSDATRKIPESLLIFYERPLLEATERRHENFLEDTSRKRTGTAPKTFSFPKEEMGGNEGGALSRNC